MRFLPFVLALVLAAFAPVGGAFAQTARRGAQVEQATAPVDQARPVEAEAAGGSKPNAAVWIAIGVVVGLLILITAINDSGVGLVTPVPPGA
jgi:hypothetical protein